MKKTTPILRKWLVILFFPSLLSAETLTESQVVMKLRSLLVRNLPQVSHVKLDNLYLSQGVPSGANFYVLNPHPPLGLVSFEWRANISHKEKQGFGNIRVRGFANVAIAKTPIRHDEGFDKTNVFFEERELSPIALSGYYLDWKSLMTIKASGYIRPGSILNASNTQKPPLISQGQWVDMIKQKGPLMIMARVRSLNDGHEKDWIKIQNPSTKKIIEARVRKDGIVEIP